MIRHHRTLNTIGEQFAGVVDGHATAAVYAICNAHGTPVLYMSVRINNRADISSGPQACALVSPTEGDTDLRSAFTDNLNGYSGATAGLIAIAHTHPPGASVQPSYADILTVPDDLYGVICHRSRHTTIWYDQNGTVERPTEVIPRQSYMLKPTADA